MKKAFPYIIRESAQAKHVRLKMSVRTGLIVVIPKGFRRNRIPTVLEENRAWLEQTFKKIEARLQTLPPEAADTLPQQIYLPAIGETWTVEYQEQPSNCVAIQELENNRLLIYGNIAATAACKDVFKQWLRHKAQHHLVPWLRHHAAQNGFHLTRVTVRSQQTRWASCSPNHTISINQKMLLLAPDLVQYLFTHELCHTIELNHSAKFWALVHKHEPEYKEKHKRLKQAWEMLPRWVDGEKGYGEV